MESLDPVPSKQQCMESRNPATGLQVHVAERWCMLSEAHFQEARGHGAQWKVHKGFTNEENEIG